MHPSISLPPPASGDTLPVAQPVESPLWASLGADEVDGVPDGSRPLSGIRVVELAQILAAPYAATMLGDLGANVIKVEPPSGDQMRTTDSILEGGGSSYFASVNRNKAYIALDLLDAGHRLSFDELVATADVFITNLRPSALLGLGLTYEALRGLNRKLIYCDISGFGERGPRSGEPGMDIIAQAVAGIMSITGTATSGPLKTGPPVADFAAALFAANGILAAVVGRAASGTGCKISVNLLDASLAVLSNFIPQVAATGQDIKPSGSGHPQLVPYQAFMASDGAYFIVGVLTEKFWALLLNALAADPLLDNPEYKTNSGRVNHRAELTASLETIFGRHPRDHWIRLLSESGVPVAPVNTIREALRDPQVVFNSTVVEVHPRGPTSFGTYTTIRNPIIIDDHPLGVRRGAANLAHLDGADTNAGGER